MDENQPYQNISMKQMKNPDVIYEKIQFIIINLSWVQVFQKTLNTALSSEDGCLLMFPS